jgi:Ca2+-binding EF-hand superfamily protein
MRKREVPVTDAELKMIFKEIDADSGGSINYAEFKQVV